jgi:hypothetical protein
MKIFIVCEASWGNSNEQRLRSLNGQENGSVFAKNVREDEAAVQRLTRVGGLIETNRTHHQPGIASEKITRRSKKASSMKFSRIRNMKFGFNEGVRSECADQPGY